MKITKGAEIFWELIFFLWFQLEVETFQVGVGCPCRGGRPKKKQLEGGWGGGMHSENMLRDSPSVRMIFGALGSQFLFGALGSYNLGALGSLKIWCCVQKLVVSSQNF